MYDQEQLDYGLYQMAELGQLELVKFLVENGADIHRWYNLALRSSAEKGHLSVVQYLVENGADIRLLGSN